MQCIDDVDMHSQSGLIILVDRSTNASELLKQIR